MAHAQATSSAQTTQNAEQQGSPTITVSMAVPPEVAATSYGSSSAVIEITPSSSSSMATGPTATSSSSSTTVTTVMTRLVAMEDGVVPVPTIGRVVSRGVDSTPLSKPSDTARTVFNHSV